MDNMKKNNNEVRPPSLNTLKESTKEMMEMRSGKKAKNYIKRQRKSS